MPQLGQTLGQRLEQRMSQNQIQSLDILALPTAALRERISTELTENPALELASDSRSAVMRTPEPQLHTDWADGLATAGQQNRTERNLKNRSAARQNAFFDRAAHHFTGKTNAAAAEASDAFQSFLENIPAPQNSGLHAHLREQLFLQRLDPLTSSFAERIIDNLTDDGFHASPIADIFRAELTQPHSHGLRTVRRNIRRALSFVRRLDPIGCATQDFQQSLAVQAEILFRKKADADPVYAYTIDILTHHFSYLENARPYSLVRAVNGNTELPYKLTQTQAEAVFSLIGSLNPFPGRTFSAVSTPDEYIIPTAFIERHDRKFTVKINSMELPLLTVSPELQDIARSTADAETQTYLKDHIQQAKVFIGSLSQREKTIIAVLRKIVSVQEAFFLTGDKRRLVPLTRQQIAQELDIHESTVSRAVAGKYIQCQWGMFEIRAFFTNAVSPQQQPEHPASDTSPLPSGNPATKEGIKECIQELLTQHAAQSGKLSDQKLADMLQTHYGISVARRTVAKYRKELNIGSSYNRI